MSDRPANEGGQPPVGPSAPTETQPTDPTIPQGWERSAQKAKEEPSSDVKTVVRAGKRCRTWLVTRTIHGPKRNGKCIPVGAPVLIAWYLGNCDWAIHQIQYGTANEYQLVNVIGVRITACDDSTTEEIVDRMTPFWKSLGPHRTVCSDTVITKVHGERPLGSDDCPKYWQPDIHGGLPSSVKDALQREADKLKPTSPGLTTMPYPFGFPPPPEPTGPTIGPMPPPEEMARRERERAERDALDPFGGEREGEGEHTHEDEPEWAREARKLRERMRQGYELEREFERWRREVEREF